jgi:hypothetical protein
MKTICFNQRSIKFFRSLHKVLFTVAYFASTSFISISLSASPSASTSSSSSLSSTSGATAAEMLEGSPFSC